MTKYKYNNYCTTPCINSSHYIIELKPIPMYIKLFYYLKKQDSKLFRQVLNFDNRVAKTVNIKSVFCEGQAPPFICICKHNNRHSSGYSTWFYVFLNNDETSSQKLSLRLLFVGSSN